MRVMDNDVPPYIIKALIDKYEGWELVELLDIKTEEICIVFEDVIADNLEDILTELGMKDEDE